MKTRKRLNGRRTEAQLGVGGEAPPAAPESGDNNCPHCQGAGRAGDQPCSHCNGSGRVTAEGIGGG